MEIPLDGSRRWCTLEHEAGVLHAVSRAGVTTTDFGTVESAVLDLDGNLLEFYRWRD